MQASRMASKPPPLACEHNSPIYLYLQRVSRRAVFTNQKAYAQAIYKAMKSVLNCPNPLLSYEDLVSLHGIGATLAKEITNAVQLNVCGPDDTTISSQNGTASQNVAAHKDRSMMKAGERKTITELYRPDQGKGPWLMLTALRRLGGPADRVDVQKMIDNLNSNLVSGSVYPGVDHWWGSACKQLTGRGLIERCLDDAASLTTSDGQVNSVELGKRGVKSLRYRLTAEGLRVAQGLESKLPLKSTQSQDLVEDVFADVLKERKQLYATHSILSYMSAPAAVGTKDRTASQRAVVCNYTCLERGKQVYLVIDDEEDSRPFDGAQHGESLVVGSHGRVISEGELHDTTEHYMETSEGNQLEDHENNDWGSNRRYHSKDILVGPSFVGEGDDGSLSPPRTRKKYGHPGDTPETKAVFSNLEVAHAPRSDEKRMSWSPIRREAQRRPSPVLQSVMPPSIGAAVINLDMEDDSITLNLENPWEEVHRQSWERSSTGRADGELRSPGPGDTPRISNSPKRGCETIDLSSSPHPSRSSKVDSAESIIQEEPLSEDHYFDDQYMQTTDMYDGGAYNEDNDVCFESPSPTSLLPLRERLRVISQRARDEECLEKQGTKLVSEVASGACLQYALSSLGLRGFDKESEARSMESRASQVTEDCYVESKRSQGYSHDYDDDDDDVFGRMESYRFLDQVQNEATRSKDAPAVDGIVLVQDHEGVPEPLESKEYSMNNINKPKRPETIDDTDTVVQLMTMPRNWFNDWEVVLLVDIREKENLTIQSHLLDMGVTCETAQLALGDFLWAARKKKRSQASSTAIDSSQSTLRDFQFMIEAAETAPDENPPPKRPRKKGPKKADSEGSELKGAKQKQRVKDVEDMVILDCIIERKTAADLAASIVDGRYKEQKSRLMKCGIRIKEYIIEGLTLSSGSRAGYHGGITKTALESAMMSIQIKCGIMVQRTRGLDHTISHLVAMHRCVLDRFKRGLIGVNDRALAAAFPGTPSNEVRLMTYSQFQRSCAKSKSQTLVMLLASQLRQIPCCSEDAAKAIAKHFGTMYNLYTFVNRSGLSKSKVENTICNIRRLEGAMRRVGPAVARYIVKLFQDENW